MTKLQALFAAAVLIPVMGHTAPPPASPPAGSPVPVSSSTQSK